MSGSANERATIVEGKLFTAPYLLILGIAAIGGALMLWRFIAGLGAVTALSDGYPWGLWIIMDVVVGTAMAAGGYAVALLCYVLNQGQYHRLVRPAVLTTALGYTIAAVGVVLDVGRYWNLWRVPISVRNWNLHSTLFEVAMCIMVYVVVLWVEVADEVFEKWAVTAGPFLGTISRFMRPWHKRALPWLLALGMLLPTMHQSSLGSLFLVSTKLHPIWHSPFLPLLFLVSCLGMGYAGVVIEATLSSRAFNREREWSLLARMSRVIAWVLLVFVVVRLGDLAFRLGPTHGLGLNRPSAFFVAETFLFAFPAVLLFSEKRRNNPGFLFISAILTVVAGAFYRFNVYLIQFNPGSNWSYFPTVPELLTTTGLIALEIAAYVFIVKRFPVLAGARRAVPQESLS